MPLSKKTPTKVNTLDKKYHPRFCNAPSVMFLNHQNKNCFGGVLGFFSLKESLILSALKQNILDKK